MHFIPPIESRPEAEEDKPCAYVDRYMSRSKALENEDADEVHEETTHLMLLYMCVCAWSVCTCV